MALEDEVENEQEVAKPTEADVASDDDEYVEEIVEEEDDGKARWIVNWSLSTYPVNQTYIVP